MGRPYDTQQWKRLRLMVLSRDPICQCQDASCSRPSAVVDHINGINTDMSMDNLRGLAKSCHDRKTAREDRTKISDKLYSGCDNTGQPTDKRHHWNK